MDLATSQLLLSTQNALPNFLQGVPGLQATALGTTVLGSLFYLFVWSFVSSIVPGLETAACFLFGKVAPDRGVYTSIGHNGIEACLFLTMITVLVTFSSTVKTFLTIILSDPGKLILNIVFLYAIFLLARDLFHEAYEQFVVGKNQVARLIEVETTSLQNEVQEVNKHENHITRWYCLRYGMFIGFFNVWSWFYLMIVSITSIIAYNNGILGPTFVIGAIFAHSFYDLIQCSTLGVLGNLGLNQSNKLEGSTYLKMAVTGIQVLLYVLIAYFIFSVGLSSIRQIITLAGNTINLII